MTSATDELRRLLDDRGVEYRIDFDGATEWNALTGDYSSAVDVGNGRLVFTGCIKPEQAIAATLGRGTCEYVIEDNMNESEGMGDVWFRCTNCNTRYDYYADDWLLRMPYCPKCGCEVER